MQLRICAKEQASSVFQHVTVYDAELELTSAGVEVEIEHIEVLSGSPMAPCLEDIEAAKAAIRRGAEDVLAPRGLGARIRVTRLLLHPVDFQALQFRRHTSQELLLLLDAQDS